MALNHANRNLHLETVLGTNAIHVTKLRVDEEMSGMTWMQLELLSDQINIDPNSVIGTNATMAIEFSDGECRYFNGYFQSFCSLDENDKGLRYYRATIVPWLWFLTQTNDCRIFQDQTVVEILEKVFSDLGFTDFDIGKVVGEHPKREYCVQYRESDFEFVSRLMEEEGIFYFFVHSNGNHVLHLADSSIAYQECSESPVDYPRSELISHTISPHITSWEHKYQFRPGAWAHTDYNFKAPRTKLMATEKSLVGFQNAKSFEVYDYPGEYESKNTGSSLARLRMEELELDHDVAHGTSVCKSFAPGFKFKIGQHRVSSEAGKSYVFRKLIHFAEEQNYESGTPTEGFGYTNQFECFPEKTNFRPARNTPKPIMRGCQTAVITGPPGEEIYPDEHGRVKVQFHWDREGKYDDKSSCWVRVSQMHAGKGWGYMDIPRIGEEVIVDFLEGDPDQPIIVGRVYNGDNKPPFSLPDGKTRRGNTTKTYKGGGYNEMTMDDTPGKEQIRIHGQYNMDSVVEHDETHTVHNNRTKQIDVDETMTIGNNQQLSVGVNKTVNIGSNHSETVGANQTINVGTNQSTAVGSNQSNAVGSMKNETVGMMSNESVGIAKTTNVGAVYSIISGAAMNTAVGFISAEEVGMKKYTLVGSEYKITAGSKFEISCGGSSIKMDSGGNITIEASSQIVLKGGGATIVMKGGIIDLN
ncbi:MAG: type VI secretion system tip protein VgrG [Planctomycetales bacterium]|nr:type VI secretion system tip protein VgrG [Planctomycetales bacterium]